MHHPVIALQEKVFKPLVEAAYYSPSAFHFDLTKAEALSLLEAFTHRQVRACLKRPRPLTATSRSPLPCCT